MLRALERQAPSGGISAQWLGEEVASARMLTWATLTASGSSTEASHAGAKNVDREEFQNGHSALQIITVNRENP